MKKYLLFGVLTTTVFIVVIYIFIQSDSKFSKSHQLTMTTLYQLKNAETDLENNILRMRSFLIPSYDPIVEEAERMTEICGQLMKANVQYINFFKAITVYCQHVDQKIQFVEQFKSQNAILKNSLYFITKMSADRSGSIFMLTKHSRDYLFANQLLRTGLAYANIPNSASKAALEDTLREAKVHLQKAGFEMESFISHTQKILDLRENLDVLTRSIVEDDESGDAAKLLIETYMNFYNIAENAAMVYRQLLFAFCIVFFFSIILGIRSLWKVASSLETANLTLESRVEQRTLDLQKSQQLIVEQQQILIASAKMSALGEMAGGVAHEINTPLAIISMRAEQLQESVLDGSCDNDYIVETTKVIKKTTDRIAKIVSGLRFFAREGSHTPFQDSLLTKVIDDTLSFCSERFSSHGVQIEIKNRELFKDLILSCRAVELSQVLLNLLNNAYDAVQDFPEKWIRIDLNESDEYVEINVIDSGNGIPPEIQEKLMQPFFTTKEVGKGTGLGLSISRGIVSAHNGKLFIDNNCKNTKFTILLPKQQLQTEKLSA